MLHSIDRRQFNEWLAEYNIEPWDGERAEPEQTLEDSLAVARRMAGV